MRVLCFLIGLLCLGLAGICLIGDLAGLSGVLGVRFESSRWASAAQVMTLSGVAWMVAAVAFRPQPEPQRPY